MGTSARYEDLKEELMLVKDRIRTKLIQGISEGNLNVIFSEGDGIVALMKKEVTFAPKEAKNEMNRNWTAVNREWNSFKMKCKYNPGSVIGGPNISVARDENDFENNLEVVKGVQILERTGESLTNATRVAIESEQIGRVVSGELTVQRDTLLRSRARLEDTGQGLTQTRSLLRAINHRVLANKFLLIFIIVLECILLVGVIYWKFFSKKKK